MGRPKGVQNKTTRIAKDAIAFAADKLGGAERLVAWAKEDGKNDDGFLDNDVSEALAMQVEGSGKDGAHLHEVAWRVVGKPSD
ncbi:hypothetical protein AB5I41_31240 [Sphingomonas sp. MMS24-JH45]